MATAEQLINLFRAAACDQEEPRLFATEDVLAWLDEAQREACVRGRLLHESSDPAMCRIALEQGRSTYPLNPAIYELDHLSQQAAGGVRRPVKLVSQEWLDGHVPEWRTREGDPQYAVQNDTSLRLVPTPVRDGTLFIEGYRVSAALEDPADTPEIHVAHHARLLDWALYRAYSRPDTDTMDLERAQAHRQEFEAYFGRSPGSDLRRITQEDQDHHNKAWL